MIASSWFTASRICVLASLVLLLGSGSSARFLSGPEAARLRGGQSADICAEQPQNSTDTCYLRQVTVDGIKYYCDGQKSDQYCPASKTVNSTKCVKTDTDCGGNQFMWNAGQWEPNGKCTKSTYKQATTKMSNCIVIQ